jgi:predicted nucleotide-binding protein (sugar kinase/HSP70/actin superfamily)
MGRTDYVMPTKPTNRTKQLGSRYSPEFICTPFKMMFGSILEVLDRGAYELVGTIFRDYCRLGYYVPVIELILEDLGYDFEFLYLNFNQPLNFIKEMKRRTEDLTYLKTVRAFQIGWIKNRSIDLIDKYLHHYQAIELDKGSAEAVAEKGYKLVVETRGMCNIRKLQKKIHKMFKKEVEIDKKANPLKVCVVGELYAVVEPAINLHVMKRLNHLGVISYTPITFCRWIDIGSRANPFNIASFRKACWKAKPYVGYRLGGKTQESLGYSIMYKKKGWDGMVHLYPFTCMPEIITRSIIPQISREYDMPILSLVLDEHTGEAGLQTRLEAFVDLIEHKRH